MAYDENVSLDEALARNRHDAETRPVVWDAEALVQAVTDDDAKVVEAAPVGIKDLTGRFLPIETVLGASGDEMARVQKRAGILPNPEAVFAPQGRLEETIVDSHMSDNEALRRAVRPSSPPRNRIPRGVYPGPAPTDQTGPAVFPGCADCGDGETSADEQHARDSSRAGRVAPQVDPGNDPARRRVPRAGQMASAARNGCGSWYGGER